MAESARRKGDVVERMLAATEAKKLTKFPYFLVKHHMPHTTTFEDLIMFQNDN